MLYRLCKQPASLGVLLASLAVVVSSCSESSTRPPVDPANLPNVILISIDTLRPDHLGCYGHPIQTSPRLDAFCEEAVVFRQTIAHAPSTLHSHASMLTSMLPHHHQATWGGKTRLPNEALTVAEVLKGVGYSTAAFTGGGQMDRVFGLDQGFDVYEQPGDPRFVGTVSRGLGWLDTQASKPFFLFLHSYEVHHPYEPSAEYLAMVEEGYDGDLPQTISIDLLREINRRDRIIGDDDLEHIRRAYDAEIRSMDDGFGLLIDGLKERGLYENALIVFTSDHGEEFGEHGVVGWHSHTLYDELLLVPLIIRFPQGESAGSEVSEQVRSIDIPATIVAACGLALPEEFDGVDLRNRERLAGEPLPAISRMDRPPARDISSVRTPEWKLHRKSLYRLESDPTEQWDMALNRRDIVEELEAVLAAAVASRPRLEPVQVVPTDATLDELRALGYLQ